MIFISGKISNPNPEIKKQNIQKFFDKEEELSKLGFMTYNPARLEGSHKNYEWYLAKTVHALYTKKITGVYFLKGWEDSYGARLEHEIALKLELEIIYES